MGDYISVLTDNLDEFLAGFWVTVRLVVFAFVIAMVVGTLVAALRIAPSKLLQRLGAVYVETFRNIPLLVLLFISFAGLRRAGLDIGPWTAGIASLGLYTAAYIAETLQPFVRSDPQGGHDRAHNYGDREGEHHEADGHPEPGEELVEVVGEDADVIAHAATRSL